MKKGKIFLFSGPSGVGKGTVLRLLQELHPEWVYPKSFVTRPMRPEESEGNPYHFISREVFLQKIEQGDFLEYAQVHDEYFYGTDKNSLLQPLQQGQVVVKECDVQGFEQLKQNLFREDFASFFVDVSGGVNELVKRILIRAPMSEAEIALRMQSYEKEQQKKGLYDYLIFNERREETVREVERIIFQELQK